MVYALVCKVCEAILYKSDEIVPPSNILSRLSFVCPNCHSRLTLPSEDINSKYLVVEPAGQIRTGKT